VFIYAGNYLAHSYGIYAASASKQPFLEIAVLANCEVYVFLPLDSYIFRRFCQMPELGSKLASFLPFKYCMSLANLLDSGRKCCSTIVSSLLGYPSSPRTQTNTHTASQAEPYHWPGQRYTESSAPTGPARSSVC
jgi:hypothetical protein